MMNEQRSLGMGSGKIGAMRRHQVRVSAEDIVRFGTLREGQTLPLLVEATGTEVDLAAWAGAHRVYIEEYLRRSGALLFRGFQIMNAETFGRVVDAAVGGALEYRERSSPRSEVGDRIYTSTDYPAEYPIFLHNEHSYAKSFPLDIFFCCTTRAQQGGETPIADCRKVYNRLRESTRQRFVEKGWLYTRNFGDGFGLPWQSVFQTSDKAVVEAYCHSNGIIAEWKDGNRLRTRQVRPAVIRHPRTGESVWFNHATFFHVSTLPPVIRDGLLAEFAEDDLPNNTSYGDGSPIEPDVLEELRSAYEHDQVLFEWQEGDVLMLDNVLTAHGRMPYSGPRKVLVALAERITRDDI